MNRLSPNARRAWIRTAYLLPAITGCFLLIYALIPHLFFKFGDSVKAILSPFTLMGNTWNECQALFEADSASVGALRFAFLMTFFVILSWVCVLFYATVAGASAVCSCAAFSHSPTAPEANRAKRWMQFFCPNRVLYVIGNLSLLLPAAFPWILQECYRSQLFYDMTLFYIGPADLLLSAIAVLVNLGAFFLTLSAQREEHMDLFRLYKKKTN